VRLNPLDQFHRVRGHRRGGVGHPLVEQVDYWLAAHFGLEQDVEGALAGLAACGHESELRPG
jgi:hypothetical protein